MFCPYCSKQNKDNTLFCGYCGKALPQKNSPLPEAQTNPSHQKTHKPKFRLSYNAKKGIVSGVLIAGLIVVVLLLYYPNVLPWNW
jgi:uncharacterized membrane protein YvbJ